MIYDDGDYNSKGDSGGEGGTVFSCKRAMSGNVSAKSKCSKSNNEAFLLWDLHISEQQS